MNFLSNVIQNKEYFIKQCIKFDIKCKLPMYYLVYVYRKCRFDIYIQ